MKKFTNQLIAVALFLVLAACGGDKNPQTPTTPGSNSKWTPEQLSSVVSACVQGQKKYYGNSYTDQQWQSLCTCFYGNAASKWAYQDFFAKINEYFNQMIQENVAQNCAQQAGLQNVTIR